MKTQEIKTSDISYVYIGVDIDPEEIGFHIVCKSGLQGFLPGRILPLQNETLFINIEAQLFCLYIQEKYK
jgi:hypothetical protein